MLVYNRTGDLGKAQAREVVCPYYYTSSFSSFKEVARDDKKPVPEETEEESLTKASTEN